MPKRKCTYFPLDQFKTENENLFKQVQSYNVELWVDDKVWDDVLDVFRNNKNKLRLILFKMFQNQYDNDLYGKENISSKCKDITAMKFKYGRLNTRLYCKEFHGSPNKKVVVIHVLEHKNAQKVDKRIKSKLEAIGDYDYEFKKEINT